MSRRSQADRWSSFGESIFSSITQKAQSHQAINLAQGFPDFPGPQRLLVEISQATRECANQYAPARGLSELREAVAVLGQEIWSNSLTAEQTVILAGATEGIFCAIVGFVNPGERILSFEPFYESYRQCAALAGAKFETIPLLPPDHPLNSSDGWQIDWEIFREKVREPFAAFIVNTPHNPTGLVLNHDDWEKIVEAGRCHQALVLSDEVYESLVYDGAERISVTDVCGSEDLFFKVSSMSKSFGFTGLKVGWLQGPSHLLEGVLRAHEAALFCLAPSLQLGIARYLEDLDGVRRFLVEQKEGYQQRLELLRGGLSSLGFQVMQKVDGGFFVCARRKVGSDFSECDILLQRAQVAALPLSSLCHSYSEQLASEGWLRFSFCKRSEVLSEALRRLQDSDI